VTRGIRDFTRAEVESCATLAGELDATLATAERMSTHDWSAVHAKLVAEQEAARAVLICKRRATLRQIEANKRGRGTSFNDHMTPGSIAHLDRIERERARLERKP